MDIGQKKTFIINAFFIAIIVILGYLTIKYLLAWLMPFVIAFLIATILQKPVSWISRKIRVKKSIVAVFVTLLTVLVFMTLIWLLAYNGINSIVDFFKSLPVWFQEKAPSVVRALEDQLKGLLEGLPSEWEGQINTGLNNVLHTIESSLTSFSGKAVRWVAGMATKLPGILMSTIISIVALFFISVGYDTIKNSFKHHIPLKYRKLVSNVWNTSGRTLAKMLQGYVLILLITFVELSIGFSLLWVDYPILIAAVTALLDILPVLGTGTILIPWALISILLGEIPKGIGLLVLYAIITVVRNIIEPRIIGARIGLHPLVTLVAMYLGLHLFGVVGMLLLPLIVILMKGIRSSGALEVWK